MCRIKDRDYLNTIVENTIAWIVSGVVMLSAVVIFVLLILLCFSGLGLVDIEETTLAHVAGIMFVIDFLIVTPCGIIYGFIRIIENICEERWRRIQLKHKNNRWKYRKK